MKDALFFDGEQAGRKLSKFWTLLPLAAVIATAGIVALEVQLLDGGIQQVPVS